MHKQLLYKPHGYAQIMFHLQSDAPVELVPCDVGVMLSVEHVPEVDLILEGSHVGRGRQWVDDSDGLRRESEVSV